MSLRNGPGAVLDTGGVPRRRYGRTPATAPGPSGPQMLADIRLIRSDPLQYLVRTRERFGSVVQFPIPSPPSYLVADADAARHVLVGGARHYDKRTLQYSALSLVTGEGLLTSDGAVWRRHRQLVQPAFHHDAVARVGDHVADAIARLDDRWRDLPSRGRLVDMDEVLMHVTLEVVGSSLFGADLSSDADRLARATLQALDVVVARARVPITPPAWIPTPANRRLSAAVRELDETVAAMVRERRHGRGSHGARDMLDLLLHSAVEGDALSVQEIRDEIVTFVVAGHETVASALAWALWLVSGDDEVQERLAAEAREVLADRAPQWTDVTRLSLARAVFDEAMRLYPPAWLVTRRVRERDVLDGREVPAGALVILSPYLVHRDPQVWPDPDRFDPGRFAEGVARGGRSAASYWPFGAGPRICIGRDFAYLEAVLLLAGLARRVRFDRVPGVPAPHPSPLVTIRPQGGVHLAVTRRTMDAG